jgi:hypothetical protein
MSMDSRIFDEPDEILTALNTSELEFMPPDRLETRSSGEDTSTSPSPGMAPILTIGEPVWYDLSRAIQSEGRLLPGELQQLLRLGDFFVVQFACSFHLKANQTVQWARFEVALTSLDKPAHVTNDPIAYDLHPEEVYAESDVEQTMKLTPKLKFGKETEFALGEAGVTIKYKNLTPIVSAAGKQESVFSWELTPKHSLRGVRTFHAVIRRPKGVQSVQATFNFWAHVYNENLLFKWRSNSSEQSSRTYQLFK